MTSRRLRFYHIVTNVVLLISFAAGICSGFSSFPDGTPLESIAFGNGVLEVLSSDPGTKEDIPAWAGKVGHEYLGHTPSDGYDRLFVRRKK